MSDMAQLLGAKELQSFIVQLFGIYDYANDTELDLFIWDSAQDNLFHYKFMLKLNIFRIIRIQ
jgi:hypothetical protein